MAIITRKITNNLNYLFTIPCPGENNNQNANLIIPASVVDLDLLTLTTEDNLWTLQPQLLSLVRAGAISVTGTMDTAGLDYDGVISLHSDSNADLRGDVRLVSGTGVTLSQVGQDITVTSTAKYLDTQVTNTLYVDNKRTDTYTENGTITKPFKTIQAAIDAVTSPSATNKYLIEIASGSYYSADIAVNKIYVTFRSGGLQSARISGKITVTNPADPTPEQITFVGLRISGGLECFASHICINAINCNVTGSDWVMNPATPTDDEYLQVFSGIWYANATLTNIYTYLMGGGYYSTFTASGKEFNINNSDINEPFEAILSGTLVGSAFGNRVGNSKFTLNAGVNLHIDADTEGGSVITLAGGTLTRSTKGSNISYTPTISGNWTAQPTTVGQALDMIAAKIGPV